VPAVSPPFTFAMPLCFQMLEEKDGNITMIHNQDDNPENPVEYYKDQWIGLPKADHPDF
jgi:hypothetical protein